MLKLSNFKKFPYWATLFILLKTVVNMVKLVTAGSSKSLMNPLRNSKYAKMASYICKIRYYNDRQIHAIKLNCSRL